MKIENRLHIGFFNTIIILLLLVVPAKLGAQRFSGGLTGGFNASQIDGDALAGFDKVGISAGIRATMDFESRLKLNVEFLYNEKGSRPDLFNPQYDPDIEVALKYAEMPVYLSIGDWWQEEGEYYKMSAHAGLSYGRLIDAKTFDYFNSSEESFDLLVPYFNQDDLSWLLGISFRMSPHWGITSRYTRGITPLLSPKKHDLATRRLLSYFLSFRLDYYFN